AVRELGAWPPEFDLQDTPKEFIVSVKVPGVAKEALQVEVAGAWLRIRAQQGGERELRKHGGRGRERYFASFARSLNLPAPVKPDETRATCRDGVLEIHLPKAKPTEVRRVDIQ
ncbi:MAG: Hsp20/alpha crystallin family protein, partial [Elusimicrobia bacterium]|nr:Hsp20/alpha crystallin family protein [Elusimicrobiota bacterium]